MTIADEYERDNAKTPLLFTFTPMHGVGLPFVSRLMADFNFPSSSLSIVESQAQPDPNFPTVKFPNPEEKGALVRPSSFYPRFVRC